MRIANGDGTPLDAVFLALSDVEAGRARTGARSAALSEGRLHEHVTDADRGHEIAVYREDDESAVF
jgi:hypothetical protein